MKICVTGSKGLLGSAVTTKLIQLGHEVHGVDNDTRLTLLGSDNLNGPTSQEFEGLQLYHHHSFDLREKAKVKQLIKKHSFDALIHCAGQPSHPRSLEIPWVDFEINASATLHLLECLRLFSPKTVFIFTSSNKVYGENPNLLPFVEQDLRYDFKEKNFPGIDEGMSIDNTIHTPFGVSKVAADLYVQEYGKTYGLFTTVLRLGCITGKLHNSVKVHGFLSFLIKSVVHKKLYTVIGFKGKQLRDQLSADDVAEAMLQIIKKPKKGAVYNLGGGKKNALSILEAANMITELSGIKPRLQFIQQPRWGDHRCYYTNNTKFSADYPRWKIQNSLEEIVQQIIDYEAR